MPKVLNILTNANYIKLFFKYINYYICDMANDIKGKVNLSKIAHNHSIMKTILYKRNISMARLGYELKGISYPTFFKYQNSPEHYTIFQLREIASLIGIKVDQLLIELELI